MRKEDVVIGKMYMHCWYGPALITGKNRQSGIFKVEYQCLTSHGTLAASCNLTEIPSTTGAEICKLRQEVNNLTARVMDLEGVVTRLEHRPCVVSVDSLSIIVEEPVQEGKAFPFGYEFPLYSHPGSCLGKTFGVDVEWEDEPPMTMDDFLGCLRHE